jgi:oligopeptide/dipeptide ABC transporter ATP-binding protein
MNTQVSADRPGFASDLLSVDQLKVFFVTRRQGHRVKLFAVDGVSFEVRRGETFAIVGESGCGKSTIANAIARLVVASDGRIALQGIDWLRVRGRALRRSRGSVQMVFQNPYGSLNPRWPIGRAVEEPLLLHTNLSRKARRARALQLLGMVGLTADFSTRLPRELSGGQRQRVAIARAIACAPALLICDEPTAALDVSIQAQVLNLLSSLQRELGLAYLFISHDLAVVRHVAHRVAVMYMGQFVERGTAEALFSHPLHPYTLTLLQSVLPAEPPLHAAASPEVDEPGEFSDPAFGCRFNSRCSFATKHCAEEAPFLSEVAPGRLVACHEWRQLDALPSQMRSP